MKGKRAFLLALVLILASLTNVFAATDVNFDNGQPDIWELNFPEGEDPAVASAEFYQEAKMLHIEKLTDTEEKAGVTRVIPAIYGDNIFLNLGMTIGGEGKTYIECLAGMETIAFGFSVTDGALAVIDESGSETVLSQDVKVGEEFSFELAGPISAPAVKINGKSLGNVNIHSSATPMINVISIYTKDVDTAIDIHHFSAYAYTCQFTFDEFNNGADAWETVISEGDIAQVQTSEKPSHLGMYRYQSSGVSFNTGAYASGNGDFKLTMDFSVFGTNSKIIRFWHAPGQLILANLTIEGTNVYYSDSGWGTTLIKSDLAQSTMHTLVLYFNKAAGSYDLCIDGEALLTGMPCMSEGVEQLGYITYFMNAGSPGAEGVGGMNIYSLKVEDNYVRTMKIQDNGFTNENGGSIDALDGGTVCGTYTIFNETNQAVNAALIMAYYEGNSLKDISVTPIEADIGTEVSVTGRIDAPKTGNAAVYKYLWNNMNDMVPLMETFGVIKE